MILDHTSFLVLVLCLLTLLLVYPVKGFKSLYSMDNKLYEITLSGCFPDFGRNVTWANFKWSGKPPNLNMLLKSIVLNR